MVNKLEEEHENIFDIYICRFIDTHIHIYRQLGFTPNIITTLSLISGCSSAYMIYKKKYKFAGLLFLIAYYLDCTDGKFARKYNLVTKFGDYYDHFSDLFKLLLIIYVLYKDNYEKFKVTGVIIVLLSILCLYQMGCQQAIYADKQETPESPTLDLFKPSRESCMLNIHNTKFFGCGTLNIIVALIIFFWNKF
jgi:hypothetical protein